MRIVVLFIFLVNFLFAFVSVNVNKDTLTLGEKVEYSITLLGEKVEFPQITDIEGFEIEATSTSQRVNIINGVQTKMITKTYVFTPTKNFTIPSYNVKVDNKDDETEPIDITIKQAQPDDNYVLELSFDKKEAFLNELIKAKITLKIDKTKKVSNVSVSKLPFDNFWYKDIGEDSVEENARYKIIQREYILFAQKLGDLNIDSASVSIITNQIGQDFFGFMVNRPTEKKIFSNENSIKINPIPNNAKFVGDFDINYNIDKTQVNANEAVNLTITIKGDGNIDDIEPFELGINGANIFKDEPIKNYKYKNGKFEAVFSQKLAIVNDKDFTINPIKFTFYSLKDKKLKTVSTKEIKIKVNNPTGKLNEPKIETFQKDTTPKKSIVSKELTLLEKLIYFIFGVIATILLYIIFKIIKKSLSIKSIRFYNKVSDRDKLKILLPKIKSDENIDELIYKLEENIYNGKKHKIILPKELFNLDKKGNY